MPYKTTEKQRLYFRIWHQVNREHHLELNRRWYQNHKEEMKARAREYYRLDREQQKAKSRQWRKCNPEKAKALVKDWLKKHKSQRNEYMRLYVNYRHALKLGRMTAPIDIDAIKKREQMRCCVCGKKVNHKDFSLDHGVPLSLGGNHTEQNLRVAHRRCNSRRGAGRLPVQLLLF